MNLTIWALLIVGQTGFSLELYFFYWNGRISNPSLTNHLTRRMRNIKWDLNSYAKSSSENGQRRLQQRYEKWLASISVIGRPSFLKLHAYIYVCMGRIKHVCHTYRKYGIARVLIECRLVYTIRGIWLYVRRLATISSEVYSIWRPEYRVFWH